MDDLYNNLKMYEPEVKGMSSSSSSTQNMAFVSSSNNNTSSSNEAVNAAHGVTTASTQVNAANTTNIYNLSDAVIYDIEEMGLRWKMDMLNIRATRFLKNTRRKISVNDNETIGFDKSKVECYNCHERGHFARECRAPKNQDNKHKEGSRRSLPIETSTSTAMVSCNGLGGYDWSDQAKEGPNYALMAYSSSSSDSKVSNDSNCLKSCMETIKLHNSQNDQRLRDLEKSSLMVLGYKTGKFVNDPAVENCKAMSSEQEPKVVKKNNDAPIIEERVSDDEKEDVSQTKTEKKIVKPIIAKIEFVKPKQNISKIAVSVNTVRQVNTAHSKTTVNVTGPMSYLSKTAHSTVKRPIHKKTAFKNSDINQRVNVVKGNNFNAVKASACWVWKPKTKGNPQMDLHDQGVIDSGSSRHMTGNMSYLTDYEDIDGGYVAFGGNPKGGKITGKSVLFNDTECIVLSPNFKLIDESQVLLRVPRKNNMYSVDLKNIVPKGGLTCLFAKATSDESKLWHRRLGKATQSLFLKKKMYCLVVTDDYSRFTWVFFLATTDETSGILKSFITEI
ncbi:ribonuclease H-like domain-containing protein [Tanacetum coccineum]